MISTPLRPGQYELRVLMTGPMPPAVGGMATVLDDMQHSSLKDKVELVMFNTAKQTPEGRSLKQAIKTRIDLWSHWWSLLIIRPNTVAHIHTCSGLTFFLDGVLVLLARINQVPVVLHIHGARFDQFLDGLSKPKLWLARLFSSLAGRVVVLSPEWQSKLSRRLPAARFVVIGNGVASHATGQKVNSSDVTLLFLGNLSHRKGIQDLVSAMSQLPAHCKLVVAGGEDDLGMMAKVRQQIRDLGLSDRVNLLGPVVGDAKYYWLNQADIFVLPSYAEGVPVSMLEAMAVGLPVVVTPVGGIPSVIQHQHNGVLVEPGNVDELAETLHVLVDDPALRQSIGQQGQLDCQQHYGVEQCVDAYLRLYTELRV